MIRKSKKARFSLQREIFKKLNLDSRRNFSSLGHESQKKKTSLFRFLEQRGFWYYFIKTFKKILSESNLLPGNELRITLKNPSWSSKGHVIKITTSF